MNRLSARLEPLFLVLLLAGAIALLQAHAIAFWREHVGPLGWAWSVLLEAVALWLWYRPGRTRWALALLASCLLLLGPVSHVSAPLVDDLVAAPHRDEARLARIEALSDQRARIAESLETFRTNSTVRSGWLPAIERSQDMLQAIDEELAELLAQPPRKRLAWRDQAIIVMQILALVLFQVCAVLIIRALARRTYGTAAPIPSPARKSCRPTVAMQDQIQGPRPAQTTIREYPTTPQEVTVSDSRVNMDIGMPAEAGAANGDEACPMGKGRYRLEDIQRIRAALDQYLASRNMSQSAFCREHDYAGRDLSLLRRHEERVEKGERTISESSLERLEAILIDILPALKGRDSSSANHATHVERPVGSHFSDGWLSAP